MLQLLHLRFGNIIFSVLAICDSAALSFLTLPHLLNVML